MENLRFNIAIFLLTLGFVSSGCAQDSQKKEPRSHIAYKTETPILIDGMASDHAWSQVDWSQNFIDIEGVKKPTYDTNIKMLWDEQYYYILAKIKEPHVWANLKQRDTVIFYNNDFEVFLDPDGDSHNYYELELNALNTAWDLLITKPYREQGNSIVNDFNILGLKSAVSVKGTLNDPSDIDEYWMLEIAIPWKAFQTSYGVDNIPRNDFWRVNFSRVNWNFDLKDGVYSRKKDENGKFMHEYNWVWSPQGVINMHEPEKWGYVYFSSKKPGEDSFEIPADEEIKWELFRLNRAQKGYFGKNQKWASTIEQLDLKTPLKMGDVLLNPVIEIHSTGWNAKVMNPITRKEHIIKEDGKIIIK